MEHSRNVEEAQDTALQRISYSQLKRHCTQSDAWLSIDGTVYDVTDFIPAHPFGDTFVGHLGTECGGLFDSAHLMVPVRKMLEQGGAERLGVKVVGKLDVSGDTMSRNHGDALLDRIIYLDTRNDSLWQDLRREVTSFIENQHEDTHYTALEGWLLFAYYFIPYVFLSSFAWGAGSALAAALLAFHMLCALSHIAHMATHHGFSRVALLDYLALTLFDLAGMSGKEWQIAHITHHNQPHSSLDNQTNRYDFMGIRLHEAMEHKWWHRYQAWYYWIVACGYLPYKLIETSIWVVFQRKRFLKTRDVIVHFACRALIIAQVSYCVFANGLGVTLLVAGTYAVVISYCAFFLLFNNHEETHELLGRHENVASFHGKLSWAEAQIRTSGNWYPTNLFLRFVEFHYGYFNYHIEHHLFPTLKPSLLKRISPIVRRVCEQHGVPYISTTYLEVQRSFLQHLRRMGKG